MKRQSTVLNLTPEPFQGIGDNPGMVKSQAVVFRYLIFNKRAFSVLVMDFSMTEERQVLSWVNSSL